MTTGDEIVIYWTNKQQKGITACYMFFITKDKKYCLMRKMSWGSNNMIYGIEIETYQQTEIQEARRLWAVLVSEHDFNELELNENNEDRT